MKYGIKYCAQPPTGEKWGDVMFTQRGVEFTDLVLAWRHVGAMHKANPGLIFIVFTIEEELNNASR